MERRYYDQHIFRIHESQWTSRDDLANLRAPSVGVKALPLQLGHGIIN